MVEASTIAQFADAVSEHVRNDAGLQSWALSVVAEASGTTIEGPAAWARRTVAERAALLTRARAASAHLVSVALDAILGVGQLPDAAVHAWAAAVPRARLPAGLMVVGGRHGAVRREVAQLEALLAQSPGLVMALEAPDWLEGLLRARGETRTAQWLREGWVEVAPRRGRGPALAEAERVVSSLRSHGVDAISAEAVRGVQLAVRQASGSANDSGTARSAAEAFLLTVLSQCARTRGRFENNGTIEVDFGGKSMEIDFLFRRERVALEVDGWFHFAGEEAYRRDRTKDYLLQRHGFFVLRVLSADVASHVSEILDRIVSVLDLRTSSTLPGRLR